MTQAGHCQLNKVQPGQRFKGEGSTRNTVAHLSSFFLTPNIDHDNSSFFLLSFFLFLFPLQPQHAPHAIPHNSLIVIPPLAPHLGGLNVGGALVVGLSEHAHDRNEDLFDGLDGGPALGGVFVVVGVVAGGVEDGDADEAAGVD